MENKWNKKNALWQLVYIILYVVAFLIVLETGQVHPVFFVCYQITAGILFTGILVKSFDRIQQPGTALSFAAVVALAYIAMGDASLWHCLTPIILGIAAEVVGLICGNSKWSTIVTKSVIMSFVPFLAYGQIWLNRDFTYECAIEDMSVEYADSLMNCSPSWAFPVVIILGIALSIVIANVTAKLFKLNAKDK